jgi:hypothetical protein
VSIGQASFRLVGDVGTTDSYAALAVGRVAILIEHFDERDPKGRRALLARQ